MASNNAKISTNPKLTRIEYWCYVNVDGVGTDNVKSYMEEIKSSLNFGTGDKIIKDVVYESIWIPVKLEQTKITMIHYYDNGDVQSCPTKF